MDRVGITQFLDSELKIYQSGTREESNSETYIDQLKVNNSKTSWDTNIDRRRQQKQNNDRNETDK